MVGPEGRADPHRLTPSETVQGPRARRDAGPPCRAGRLGPELSLRHGRPEIVDFSQEARWTLQVQPRSAHVQLNQQECQGWTDDYPNNPRLLADFRTRIAVQQTVSGGPPRRRESEVMSWHT